MAPTPTTAYREEAGEGGGYQYQEGAAAQAQGRGALPYTGGADPALIVSIAMALLSAGGLLILAAKRSGAFRRGRH
jgi:LPXTG-motif cell wall-anchored protein